MGKAKKEYDLTGNIIAYESGELSEQETIELFQHLIDSNLAWTLQGHYGRTATALIRDGHCTPAKQPKEKAVLGVSSQPLSDRGHVGPYCGVQKDEKVVFNTGRDMRTFRVIVYAAYNACGLIGSEHNGVLVLDEDGKKVLTDRLAQADTGYYGATEKQLNLAERLCNGSWCEFKKFINEAATKRYAIE